MFEKVNPSHPDKVADRIAGAIVDLAYKQEKNPKIAVEVLIGHDECNILIESSTVLEREAIAKAVKRIAGEIPCIHITQIPQDIHLSENQSNGVRCGDNGIFCGMPITDEQYDLSRYAKELYSNIPYDGKFILAGDKLIACQSHIDNESLSAYTASECRLHNIAKTYMVNPLGYWTGGVNVDSGATNRKLGSDMGDAVTGGGLHGKDLSKADVSVNIYAHLKAQEIGKPVRLFCAIGDETVDGKPYAEIVDIAKQYISNKGGFEKFAEWGLV